MKQLKEFFSMIITAVICFTMNVFSRKSEGKRIEGELTENQNAYMDCAGSVVADTETERILFYKNKGICFGKNNYMMYKKYSFSGFLKKIFFWLQGPGDLTEVCEVLK